MNKNTIAVIAAHPDDEVLGCGATIAKHIQDGDKVHVLIMAEGLTARGISRDREAHSKQFNQLSQAAQQAHEVLGSTSLDLLSLPDNRMDSIDRLDIIKQVEKFIQKFNPNIVYTHHCSDVNIDHRRVHEAVITASRPQPSHPVKLIYAFEVQSSTEWQPPASGRVFSPNHFVCIKDTLRLKLKALEAYSSEMREWPHARSVEAIEALAKWRGSCIGVDSAEAFEVLRQIRL